MANSPSAKPEEPGAQRDWRARTLQAAILRPRSQPTTETAHPLIAWRYYWAHACRDGEVVCGRVELAVRADTRLGLAPRERRCLGACFREHLHPAANNRDLQPHQRAQRAALARAARVVGAHAFARGCELHALPGEENADV